MKRKAGPVISSVRQFPRKRHGTRSMIDREKGGSTTPEDEWRGDNPRQNVIRKMIKYGIVGIIGAGLHFAVLIGLVEWAHIHPVISSAAGFIAALISSFLMNKHWTFSTRLPRKKP